MAGTFSDRYVRWAQRLLPMPFTIAVVLTAVTFLLALLLTEAPPDAAEPRALQLLLAWESGLWGRGGMVFTFQMILILVLGHTLALSRPADALIRLVLRVCRDTASSAAAVCAVTLAMAYLNWGLGLVFGAIFARKVGERARRAGFDLNYPLVGAAGYAGLMVWHGGLSGSAPITVSGQAHNLVELTGTIPLAETIGSTMNITVIVVTMVALPLLMWFLGKRSKPAPFLLPESAAEQPEREPEWAEKLDRSQWLSVAFGTLMIALAIYRIRTGTAASTLDLINLALFGSALSLHRSFARFIAALDDAIRGAAGIAIQFPLYFGIMGIMTGSGLLEVFADFFVRISNETTFPLFTFVSAGIVNVFVPSGGGQWQVQGPIIIQAAQQLGVPSWKAVMALSYGDQLTNMLQPFWALPLLGITGLKAREILPYTLVVMLAGAAIFATALLVF